jgi:hypothetical protein
MSDSEQTAEPQPEILLELTRGLVAEEAIRDEALNTRAVALVALAAVLLTLTAALAPPALDAGWSHGWRDLALTLILALVVTLRATIVTAVTGVLRPRRFAMLATAEVKKFLTPEYLERSDAMNRKVLLTGMIDVLEHERNRAARKATALRRSYALILTAAVLIAATATLTALRSVGIIHSRYARGGADTSRPAAAARPAAAEAGGDPDPAPADRVRGEGGPRPRR